MRVRRYNTGMITTTRYDYRSEFSERHNDGNFNRAVTLINDTAPHVGLVPGLNTHEKLAYRELRVYLTSAFSTETEIRPLL